MTSSSMIFFPSSLMKARMSSETFSIRSWMLSKCS